MVKLLINFFIIFIWFQSLNSEEIYGMPKIIDGDTVHIKSKKIRLEGIDAPEIKQQCQKTYLQISTIVGFNFKKNYSCGIISKKKLIDKINKSQINCIASGRDRYKRYLATCYKDKINLNKWMVRNGYAVAYKRYSRQYLNDEKFAEDNKLGIWKGTFLRPEKWRKLN